MFVPDVSSALASEPPDSDSSSSVGDSVSGDEDATGTSDGSCKGDLILEGGDCVEKYLHLR